MALLSLLAAHPTSTHMLAISPCAKWIVTFAWLEAEKACMVMKSALEVPDCRTANLVSAWRVPFSLAHIWGVTIQFFFNATCRRINRRRR